MNSLGVNIKCHFAKLGLIVLLTIILFSIMLLSYFVIGDDFFSPYTKFLAERIFDVKFFLVFMLVYFLTMAIFEYFVRQHIQSKLLAKWTLLAKVFSVIVPTFLLILLHLPFGQAGVFFGGVAGLVLGIFYLYKNDWQILAVWHSFWVLCLVPFLLMCCLFSDSQIRYDFLFAYKKRHINKEMMYFRENWGWVDKVHYRQDHYDILEAAIEQADETGEVSLTDGWITPLGINVQFSGKFAFKKPSNDLDKWAMVTGMMLYFMDLNESTQEQSPWYHGNQLSAWQFDDLSSCLLCCFDNYPTGRVVPLKNIFQKDELLKIWERNGAEFVRIKMKEDKAWELLPKELRDELRNKVAAQKANWRVIDKQKFYK